MVIPRVQIVSPSSTVYLNASDTDVVSITGICENFSQEHELKMQINSTAAMDLECVSEVFENEVDPANLSDGTSLIRAFVIGEIRSILF